MRPFKPFTGTLWALLLVVILCTGMMLAFLDSNNTSDFPKEGFVPMVTKSVYLASLGWVSAALYHNPLSRPARLVSIVYGFFILIVAASFTANTASFLLAEATAPRLRDIEDGIKMRLKICVNTGMYNTILMRYPQIATLVVRVSGPTELVEKLGAGACEYSILSEPRLLKAQAQGQLCGFVLVGGPVLSFPVGSPVAPPLRNAVSWAVSKSISEGGMFDARRASPLPEPACASSEEEMGAGEGAQPIGAREMSGALLILACSFPVGAAWLVAERCAADGAGANPAPRFMARAGASLDWLVDDCHSSGYTQRKGLRRQDERRGDPSNQRSVDQVLDELHELPFACADLAGADAPAADAKPDAGRPGETAGAAGVAACASALMRLQTRGLLPRHAVAQLRLALLDAGARPAVAAPAAAAARERPADDAFLSGALADFLRPEGAAEGPERMPHAPALEAPQRRRAMAAGSLSQPLLGAGGRGHHSAFATPRSTTAPQWSGVAAPCSTNAPQRVVTPCSTAAQRSQRSAVPSGRRAPPSQGVIAAHQPVRWF